MNENVKAPRSGISKTIYCLFPLIIYIAVNLGLSVIFAILTLIPGSFGSGMKDFISGTDGTYVISVVFDTVLIAAAFIMRRHDLNRGYSERGKKTYVSNFIIALVMGFGMGIVLNLLVSMAGADELMEKFDPARVEMLSSGNLVLKFLLLCIFAPIAEELIFRVLLFGRMRKYMKFLPAALISALCFGIVHIEPVTGACAFIIGILMAFILEKTGNIVLSMFFHFGFNFFPTLLLMLNKIGGDTGALDALEEESLQDYANIGMIIWLIFGAVIFLISFIMFIRRNKTAVNDTAGYITAANEAVLNETDINEFAVNETENTVFNNKEQEI